MNFLMLLVASLATFRLALLFSSETGPMRIFARLRRAAKPGSNLREGLSCFWCESLWHSAVTTTALFIFGYIPGREWPLYWLAVSAGAVVLNQAFIAKPK